jgi:hypothetical protein
VPTLPSAQIPIEPLDPTIVRLITDTDSFSSKCAETTKSLFEYNHISSLTHQFVKTSSSKRQKNDFDQHNDAFSNTLPNPNAFKVDGHYSSAALQAAIKQFATGLGNIFETRILENQTRLLLKKLFSHRFAPARTARHLAYCQLKKKDRPSSSTSPYALLESTRKRLAAVVVKKQATSSNDEALVEKLQVFCHLFSTNSRRLSRSCKVCAWRVRTFR